MNIHVFSSLALLCCLYLQYSEASKQCVRIQDSPFASCAAAGYSYTYPLPDGLSQRTLSDIKRKVTFITSQAANCSVAQIAETIACMSYAPRCEDASKDPVLPCRRVCSELFKRCSGTISEYLLEGMRLQCLVLPDNTPASGKCYEPKQFDQHFKPSSKGPLERGCQKLVNFPFCEGMGYSFTTASAQEQLQLYRMFYRKNLTDPDPSTPAAGAIMNKVIWRIKNTPKCADSIKKLFCSGAVPPCFPVEGPAYYTVCQPVCKSIGEQCPEALTGRGSMYYGNCERMAPGTAASHGYCKHSKLPPITDWYSYLKDKPTASPPKGTSKTVIIIIVIVIAVAVIVITGVVIVCKRRRGSY